MTKENSRLYLPMVQALADGKTIQFLRINMGWVDVDSSGTNFPEPPDRYRIKPEPVMVPLGPEDVPPGSALRYKLAQALERFWMVNSVSDHAVNVYSRTGLTAIEWGRCMTEMEIKRHGEDWQPCHKPAP